MSYQVLARKWRPRQFSEMVGQEHVLRALTNALDSQRLHHAFLFTGTRGVGKTTISRILAKSLNCETNGVSSAPCGQCRTCQEIDEGRFVDLIEVDAASRTKVEDTRELLDNVQYAPTRGSYKVYLIDEVHMLSTSSFNALLKTLEEPPPHVKFLLATTDPQKLPVTVLSRCLQFNLKRMPPELIEQQLQRILTQEALEFEHTALRTLAVAADGSMRDGLSLLDQAIAFGGGAVREVDVRAMLGSIEQYHVVDILRLVLAQDGEAVLNKVASLAERVPNYADMLGQLIRFLHHLAIAQTVPKYDLSDPELEAGVQELKESVTPEDIQLLYQIALTGFRDLPLSPDQRIGFEMALLRMLAFVPLGSDVQAAPTQSISNAQKSARPLASSSVSSASPMPAPATPQQHRSADSSESNTASIPTRSAPQNFESEETDEWHRAVKSMRLGGMTSQLAANCTLKSKDGNLWTLVLDKTFDNLLSGDREKRLQEALRELVGTGVQLKIEVGAPVQDTPAVQQQKAAAVRQSEAEQAIENDAFVQGLQQQFDATIQPGSVKPIDQ